MFCYKCGKKAKENSRFCEYCGANLNPEASNNPVVETKLNNHQIQQSTNGNSSKPKRIFELVTVIVLSFFLSILMISSFRSGSSYDATKIVKKDGITITYEYTYDSLDGETVVYKTYEGTDSDGNVVGTRVLVSFEGTFEGKIDPDYKAPENGHNWDNYGEVKISGTINGYRVYDEDEKLLIDSEVYEKYTDMIEEIKGCDLYVTFVDENTSYKVVNRERVVFLIMFTLTDLIAIGTLVFTKIKDKKIEMNKISDRQINIQNKVGIGFLIGALVPLSILFIGFLPLYLNLPNISLLLYYISYMLSIIGYALLKKSKLHKVTKILLIIMFATMLFISTFSIFFGVV